MGKHQQNIEDINFIAHEISKFSSMTLEDFKTHIKQQPANFLYTLELPSGQHIQIGREAALRFNSMAKRYCKLHPYIIDELSLERAIKTEFVKTFIEDKRPIEIKFIDRMLNNAVKRNQITHKAITHYLSCVIIITPNFEPNEFKIGPVRFITTKKFFMNYGSKIEADYASYTQHSQQTIKQEKLEANHQLLKEEPATEESAKSSGGLITSIYDCYKSYIWVAEITVPICDEKISREKALRTVQGALDILKLFFGHRHGHDLRIGYDTARPEHTATITRTSDGMFHYEFGYHGAGAYANSNWYSDIVSHNGLYLAGAGNAIEGYLKPEIKSEHRDRWLRALNWCGQAISDNIPAFQLVKYVAALECLTVTPADKECGVTDIVTRRTALLIAQGSGDDVFKKTYAAARKIYRFRSDLMHGRVSPTGKDVENVMPLAHQIGQEVMFAALGLFGYLEMNGRTSSRELFDQYRELEKQRHIEEK